MATVALPFQSATDEFPILPGSWSAAEPQGGAGRQLRDNARSALAHWRMRAEHLLGVQEAEESYVSVPFTPVKSIRVRVRRAGALKPVPYP